MLSNDAGKMKGRIDPPIFPSVSPLSSNKSIGPGSTSSQAAKQINLCHDEPDPMIDFQKGTCVGIAVVVFGGCMVGRLIAIRQLSTWLRKDGNVWAP